MSESRASEVVIVVALLGVVVLALFVAGGGGSDVLGYALGDGSGRAIHVHAVENESDVDGEVVSFDSLTPDQRRLFEEARTEGYATIPEGVELGPLGPGNGVRYGGEVYAVLLVVS